MPTGLNDLLSNMPTGHNDLWATENVKVRDSEFLYETSFDHVILPINHYNVILLRFIVTYKKIYIYIYWWQEAPRLHYIL